MSDKLDSRWKWSVQLSMWRGLATTSTVFDVVGSMRAALMRELGLVSKQPGSHAYRQAMVERPDIPNRLNREFAVQRPNQVWCGDSCTSGRKAAGITWRRCWICRHGG